MKGEKRFFSLIFAILGIAICLSACAPKENDPQVTFSDDGSEISSSISAVTENYPVLTYLSESDYVPSTHTVEEVNRYLLECEKEYQVEFVPLPDEDYKAALEEYLAAGNPADLISVASLPEVWDQLLDLTSYLDSEDGALLKSIYSDFGWGQVALAEKIYTVPSNLYYDAPDCYLVNRKLMEQMELTEADLQKPLWELHNVLAQVRDKNPQKDFFPLLLENGRGIWNTNQAYKPVSGFAVDRETREAAYIFDRPEVLELMRALHQYTREGLVGMGPTGTEYSNECSRILLDNTFLVYCSGGISPYNFPYVYRSPDVYAEENEDYLEIVWREPTIYCDRRPDGTGVAADSQYQEEALDFLTLVMTDRKLTDFLQHGAEGMEYLLTEDGKVSPIEYEGDFAYRDYRSLLYGNRMIATPTIYEFADKQERAEMVFANGIVSQFVDDPVFIPTMEQNVLLDDALKEILAVLDPDDDRSNDEIVSAARSKMDEAGGQEILAQLMEEK